MNIIVDFRASKNTIDALLKLNLCVIKTPKLNSVYDAICGHPDIMFHKISDAEAVCEPSVYDYFCSNLPEICITKGLTFLSNKYPGNIAYNSCRLSDKVFCNVTYTDKEILKRYEDMSLKIINIKQGYAGCSICKVADNAIITSDMGILKAAEKNGVDVLLVDNSDIKLEGFKNGFIGGATGLIKDKLLVNGNVEYHRDHQKIIDFCQKYGVEVVSLNSGEIVDIGSIIAI